MNKTPTIDVQKLLCLNKVIFTYIAIVFGIALTCFVFYQLLKLLYSLKRQLRDKRSIIFIEPPLNNQHLNKAMAQLYGALHTLAAPQTVIERMMGYRETITFEINGSKLSGIVFYCTINKAKANMLRQQLITLLPHARTSVEDCTARSTKGIYLFGFKQTQPYPLPLKTEHEETDPLTYITNTMTKLGDDENISYQITVTPTRIREVDKLRAEILDNKDVLNAIQHNQHSLFGIFKNIVSTVCFGFIDMVSTIGDTSYSGGNYELDNLKRQVHRQQDIAMRIKPVRTLSYFEHQLVESVSDKLAQPLFKATVTVAIGAANKELRQARKRSMESAVGLLAVPKYQSLKSRKFYGLRRKLAQFNFAHTTSLLSDKLILAPSELASLYHYQGETRSENSVTSFSRVLPATIAMKQQGTPDFILGINKHHGSETLIGLSKAERERHCYIVGGTGNGKTTMLLNAIVQDITSGKGIAVLDPHGDLAETILQHIPEERIKDVIYLNPDDLGHPIGINLLELKPGLSGDELLREKDLVTESTISVMRKVFSEDDSGGHRIEYVLRNAIQTALTMPDPTLFTIFELLTNKTFRKTAVSKLEDENLKNFWNNELGKAGDFQRVKMAAGITAKVGRFLFSASARRVLEQPKSTIDFDDILDSGKILICNFSKGLIGEDTSTLFGTTVLAKIQMAALSRARSEQALRTSFYLYIDEFQNFATSSFVQMLSEARKYKLFLTMAEQSTSQQDKQRMVDIILANVGTVVCFRSGSPADERLLLPLFRPFLEENEISNLPTFNFYARISALQPQEPMSGETIVLTDVGNKDVAERVKELSRAMYGKNVVRRSRVDAPLDKVKTTKPKPYKRTPSTALQPVRR